MEINLTLLIQVVNFFIAWALLRILYFKPAIEYLAHRKKEYDCFINTLGFWQTKITSKEQEQSSVWSDFKTFSKLHGPSISKAEVSFKYSHPSSPHIDKNHMKELIEETKDLIVQGVSRVDI
jgi:hypothetical protein